MSHDITVTVEDRPVVVEVIDLPIEISVSGGVGPVGPPGPQGPPGSAGGTRNEELFTNSTVVVVTHNLGYEPIVYVLVSGELVDTDVVHSTLDQFTLTLGSPTTGKVVYI